LGKLGSKSIPAAEIERYVIDQSRATGKDSTVVAETIRQMRAQADKRIKETETEQATLEKELAALKQQLRSQNEK
jgi:peptidoglycan hydrolase CwlO-like protein